MLEQQFVLDEYNWTVEVYYYIDCYYINPILSKLMELGATDDILDDSFNNMKDCALNTGLTYTNNELQHSVIVISKTSEPAEFMNSFIHEASHLASHIEQEFGINPYSEEAAYLLGDIVGTMFPKAKRFLCDCYK